MSNVTCTNCARRVFTPGKEIQSICALTDEYVWSYVQLNQVSKRCPLPPRQTEIEQTVIESRDTTAETLAVSGSESEPVSPSVNPTASQEVKEPAISPNPSPDPNLNQDPSPESLPVEVTEVKIEGNWPDAVEERPVVSADPIPATESNLSNQQPTEQKEQKKFEYRQNKGKR